eukprot:6765362-Karenia_brevis.AAC.1
MAAGGDVMIRLMLLRMVPRSYKLTADDTVWNAPGVMQGKVRSRKALVTLHGGAADRAPKLKMRPTILAEVVVKPTVVLRFSTENGYKVKPTEGNPKEWRIFVNKHAQHIN